MSALFRYKCYKYDHNIFRRPIRQSRFLDKPSPVLPNMLQKVNAAKGTVKIAEPFKYDASFDFEKSPFFDSFFSKRPK